MKKYNTPELVITVCSVENIMSVSGASVLSSWDEDMEASVFNSDN